MINIKDIRSQKNFIIESLNKRNFKNSEKIIKEVIDLDKDYRVNLEKKEKLLNERNVLSKELSKNISDKKKLQEIMQN